MAGKERGHIGVGRSVRQCGGLKPVAQRVGIGCKPSRAADLAAEILGDKWTLLILREAFYGVKRYDDIRQDTGAPRAVLSDRLSKLVALGILTKTPYQEEGARARHGYALTAKGTALGQTMMAMSQWGEAHVTGQPAPVKLVDQTTGETVRVGYLTTRGKPVQDRHVALKLKH